MLKALSLAAEQTGQVGYMLKLESSDAANLSAEAVGLGYRSSEGISPGRLLRTAQALARAIMLTLKSAVLIQKKRQHRQEQQQRAQSCALPGQQPSLTRLYCLVQWTRSRSRRWMRRWRRCTRCSSGRLWTPRPA